MSEEGREGAGRLRWAEVDLDAIRHNVATLRRRIPPPTRLAVVLKADAYGHGAVRVARAAVEAGAGWLAVATVGEALELRAAGIGVGGAAAGSGEPVPILVMGPPSPEGLVDAVAADVRLCVYDREGIEMAAEAARRAGRPARLHLKVDTGMHRLGAEPGGVLELARVIAADPALALEALWTHFGEADDGRRATAQLAALLEEAARLAQAEVAVLMLHAANSAAALLHPEARLDMVRCGLPVYGYAPAAALADLASNPETLRAALSWHARVVAVHDVEPGARVGYGGEWVADRRARIATATVGYADGYFRSLAAGGAEVLVRGRRAPLAGRVSMDFIGIDVSAVPGVTVGDTVTLLGRQGDEAITADELAARAGTISWEVLCAIGPRVERVEVGAAAGEVRHAG